MIALLAVAATVLASPPQGLLASALPKGAVFQVLANATPSGAHAFPSARCAELPAPFEAVGGFIQQLAVVKPHRAVRQPPSLQMFLTVAPVGKSVGLRAIGRF